MSQSHPDGHMPGRFPTTQWSRVVTAASHDASDAREALSGLCQAYWYPIYAYVRHRGYPPEQARDLTQDFFAYVLERDLIARADPARGRFRAFLRTVCARHLADWRDRENAARRGGGRPQLSIDPLDAECRYKLEPTHELTPERIFDRTWALTLLDRVVERLRREYDDAGRAAKFEALIGVLTRDPGSGSYAEISSRMGTTEGNVRVAVHRLRRRYGLLLREEIAATVGDSAQVDDEIRTLFAALEG
jgi:RNA polymerase sigma factor (sigma-70 family)